jgi:GAF domain-containing protein
VTASAVDTPAVDFRGSPVPDDAVSPNWARTAPIDDVPLDSTVLCALISTLASNPDLDRRLLSVIDILTTATECRAGFIYSVHGDQLKLCAASIAYSHLVGRVQVDIARGHVGWAVRNRKMAYFGSSADPAGIPRSHQGGQLPRSMMAVPIPSRGGEVIGVIALHTNHSEPPDRECLSILDYAAQLVGDTLESAQVSELSRQRGSALAELGRLSDEINEAADRDGLFGAVASGLRDLVHCERSAVYDVDGEELRLVAAVPEAIGGGRDASVGSILLEVSQQDGGRPVGGRLRDALGIDAATPYLRATPVAVGGECLGLLCIASSTVIESDVELLLSAVANQLALALMRLELVEHRAEETSVSTLFAALESDSVEAVERAAARTRRDFDHTHFMIHCEPARDGTEATDCMSLVPTLETSLRKFLRSAACLGERGRIRGVAFLDREASESQLATVDAALAELGTRFGLAVGRSEVRNGAADTAAALGEAADSARVAGSLQTDGGALAYSQLGAYRYLLHVDTGTGTRDPFLEAVRKIMSYDERRGSELTSTLEQYLSNRRRVTETARALTVHPNTLRQRLERIEALTGLDLTAADFLALELALKLAQLNRSAA